MVNDVKRWLEDLDLDRYVETFEANAIDMEILPDLDDADLEKIGVAALGHRKKLLRAIAEQGSAPASAPIEPQEVPSEQVERRHLTVMFCDLADSTILSTELDPEDLQDVIRAYQNRVTDIVRHYEGFVAKYMGDGILIYFGYPKSLERNAERAARSALEIVEAMAGLNADLGRSKEAELTVRIGIATGLVVVGEIVGEGLAQERTVIGEAPNVAARLQGIARRNGIVVDLLSKEVAGDAFVYEDLGFPELKGITGDVQAWAVVDLKDDVVHVADRGLTDGAEVAPVLIGRDEETGLLRRAWQSTKDEERGQVVTISGEAGIGKSVLIEGLVAEVHAEALPHLTLRCSPYHTSSAFYPIIEYFKRLAGWQSEDSVEIRLGKLEAMLETYDQPIAETMPMLAGLLSMPLPEDRYPPLALTPQQKWQKTQDSIIAVMLEQAEHQALLQLWEDLHWADPSTLELLGLLIDQVPTASLLVVLTVRPDFVPPWPARSHITPIALNRLERRHTEALVARIAAMKSLPGEVVDHIVTKTDGVPLYVEELTKTILASNILRDTGKGLELTEPLSSLAIPGTLQESLMARLDRLPNIREVAQLGSVLGREFVYEMVQAIASIDESTLKNGLEQLVAAELLHQRGRPPRAKYIFKHALIRDAAYESLLKSRRRELHRNIAQILSDQATDQATLVAYHWEQAEELEQAFTHRLRAAEQAASLHAVWEVVSEYWSALHLLDRMPGSPDIEPRRTGILLSLVEQGAYFWRNEAERALASRHLDTAIETASEAGQLATLARLQAYKGYAWDDENLLAIAVENAQASEDKSTQAWVADRCALYYGMHGLFERSHEHIERAMQIFEDLDEKLTQGVMLAGAGRCFYGRAGRLDDSFRCAKLAREIATEIDSPLLNAWLAMEAEPLFYKGLWEETVQFVEAETSAAWEIGAWDVILWTYAWAAIAYLKLERVDHAERLIEQAMSDVATRAGYDFPKIYILIALAQLQVVSGDAKAGIESGQQALELAERIAIPLEQGAAHRALAQAHEADGDNAAARAQFESSLAILGKIQSPPELAQSLLAYGRFQLKTNAEEGRELMDRALAIFEDLNATGWVEETRAALALA